MGLQSVLAEHISNELIVYKEDSEGLCTCKSLCYYSKDVSTSSTLFENKGGKEKEEGARRGWRQLGPNSEWPDTTLSMGGGLWSTLVVALCHIPRLWLLWAAQEGQPSALRMLGASGLVLRPPACSFSVSLLNRSG